MFKRSPFVGGALADYDRLCGLNGYCLAAVFSWVHFQTPNGNFDKYQVVLFGIPTVIFDTHSLFAKSLFHALIFSTIPIIGLAFAITRRLRDRVIRPRKIGGLIGCHFLLSCIAVTGLSLSVSYTFFAGAGFLIIAWSHAVSVIVTLLWLPYGKLLHVLQRPAKRPTCCSAAERKMAVCSCCGREFAGASQVEDIQRITDMLGYKYQLPNQMR